MEYKELEDIGLTKREALVYTTLLRIGSSSTGKIVREAKISSGKIYETLDRLKEKGMVSYILKNNVRYFSASDPIKIREYIEKRKNELAKKEKAIEHILPQLTELKKHGEEEYSAEIYTGFNGFKTAVMSVAEGLETGSEWLSLGGSGIRDAKINIIWKRISEIMKKKKIKMMFIVTDDSKESKQVLKKYKDFIKARYLPGFHLAPVMISHDKILHLNFKELSVIVIKSKTIATQFKFFFESLWKTATL